MRHIVRRVQRIASTHKRYVVIGLGVLIVLLVATALFMRQPKVEQLAADTTADKAEALKVAARFVEREQFDKARQAYDIVLKSEASNIEALLGKARALVAESALVDDPQKTLLITEAQTVLKDLVQKQPSEPRGYLELAKIQSKDEAILTLKKARLYLTDEPAISDELRRLETQ